MQKQLTFLFPHAIIIPASALVAQLDRVTGYEPVGRGFESLPAHHAKDTLCHLTQGIFFII